LPCLGGVPRWLLNWTSAAHTAANSSWSGGTSRRAMRHRALLITSKSSSDKTSSAHGRGSKQDKGQLVTTREEAMKALSPAYPAMGKVLVRLTYTYLRSGPSCV
jgi:hypothetical protein